MSTNFGPEPRYFAHADFSALRFGDAPSEGEHEVAAKYVDPEVRREGAEWLAREEKREASDAFFLPTTTIIHHCGSTPEQIAADLLMATFSALGAVRVPNDLTSFHLTKAQGGVAEALQALALACPASWPVIA